MSLERLRAAKRKQLRRQQERRLDAFMQQVQVVSDDEAEQADMVVCMPDVGPRYFPDDLTAACAECGVIIRHRPHVPQRPKKVCIHCALRIAEAEKESG